MTGDVTITVKASVKALGCVFATVNRTEESRGWRSVDGGMPCEVLGVVEALVALPTRMRSFVVWSMNVAPMLPVTLVRAYIENTSCAPT